MNPLELLKQFVEGSTHYSASSCRSLLSSLFISPDVYHQTMLRFSAKEIVYVRHGETPINVWVEKNPIKFMLSLYPSDPAMYNPGLTRVGIRSCEVLKQLLEKNYTKFDMAISSPYKRTILTHDVIKHSGVFGKGGEEEEDGNKKKLRLVVTPLIRERASIPASVVGYPKSYLQAARADIECSLIAQEFWWRTTSSEREAPATRSSSNCEKEHLVRENDEALQLRVLVFLVWLAWREEQSIIFFSHCSVYEAIKNFQVHKPPNAVPIPISADELAFLIDSLRLLNHHHL